MTDPDSRRMKAQRGYMQGYNAQAVVNEQQIVLAAEITTSTDRLLTARPDDHRRARRARAGRRDRPPSVVVADAQYWNEQHMDDVIADSTSRC